MRVMHMKSVSYKRIILSMLVVSAGSLFAGKPVALMGFGTDVKAMKSEVVNQSRYASVSFVDKWVEPKDYEKYSVLYFGEKLRGEAKGKNWIEGEAREAAEKFIANGGVVIVAGRGAMSELLGKPDGKKKDPLREKVIYIPRSYGRMLVNFAKDKKKLSFPDDEGNDILTAEGREAKALQDQFIAAFAKGKDIEKLPELEKWIPVPLGEAGNQVLPSTLPRKPKFLKPVERADGVTLLDGSVKTVIVVPKEEEQSRKLADELVWHLEKMSGEKFEIVESVPEKGPALVYRTLRCPEGFARGSEAYFKIWREGDKVILGGEGTGKSRATTYVLEALGCRYLWPGESGKVIPKKTKIILPEIAVEDATPLVVRRARLYRWPEHRDIEANRDFWRWHGMNDMKFMTDRPGAADKYEWGHYYADYYPKYSKSKPKLFALQPDGTRKLHLGKHTERPTFCLSNPELVEITVKRKLAEIKANPDKKAFSLCLPDGATSTWCMCEECRKLDPVNGAKINMVTFFPERRPVPYVAFTDRVFDFMNRLSERISAEYPDKLLSTYAYAWYTAPPVKVKPHPNLLILSVAGNYSNAASDGSVEKNIAAWKSFGNKILWRPNAHRGFRVHAPDNFARRMFADISLLIENGIFGVDYDTMYCEWAVRGFVYYVTAKAHFNPDRLDYDAFADDYCKMGFGAAAKPLREYFDALERATTAAAAANAEDKAASVGWAERERRQNRLFAQLDFDALDALLAQAKSAAKGDEAVLKRLERLQFGNDLGRFFSRMALGKPSKPTDDEKKEFRKYVDGYLSNDPAAYKAKRIKF